MSLKESKDKKRVGPKAIIDRLTHAGLDPVFLFVLFLAAYIRLVNLLDAGFYDDEAHEVLMARDLWSQDFPSFILTEGEFLHILILKTSFTLLGASELSARLPGLIFSICTIGLVMKLSFDMFKDRRIGYLAGFLMTISAWHIEWSIMARPYSLLILLGVMSTYLAFKAAKDGRALWYYLLSGVLILALFTSRFALLLPFIVLIYFSLSGRMREKHCLISMAAPVVIWLGVGAYIIYSGYLDEILKETTGQWWSNTEPTFYYDLLFNRLTLVALACSGIGIYALLRRPDVKPQVLVLFFITYFIMLGFFFHSKQDRYLAIIIPAVYLLTAYGAFYLFKHIKAGPTGSKLIPVFVIFLLVVGDLAMFTPARSSESYRENYTEEWDGACHYVERHWKEGDYLLATVSDPVEYYFRAPDYEVIGQWDKAAGIIWGTDIPVNSTVWLVADHGRFDNSLAEWQRDWVWQNMDCVWQSEHNLAFRGSRFDTIWRGPLQNLTSVLRPADIILTSEAKSVREFLGRSAYDDWKGELEEYNATFSDAVWQNNIPLNITVWFVVTKDEFNLNYQYWQRDWIWRNFETYWESEHVYIFRGSKFDRVWKEGLEYLDRSLTAKSIVLTTNAGAIMTYLNHSAYDDWYGTVAEYNVSFQDAVWQNNIPWGTPVWFVIEVDVYYNDWEFWQRDWIGRNYDLAWQDQHLMIYKGHRWNELWEEPLKVLQKIVEPRDIVLSNSEQPAAGWLNMSVYTDWNGIIEEYNVSFSDAVWHDDIPDDVVVYFIIGKDHYYYSLKDWQRDWIATNFDTYWESDYSLLFKNDGK